MVLKIKIKEKGRLRKLFRTHFWDSLVFWRDGSWAHEGSNYATKKTKKNGESPILEVQRISADPSTQKEGAELIKVIEISLEKARIETEG